MRGRALWVVLAQTQARLVRLEPRMRNWKRQSSLSSSRHCRNRARTPALLEPRKSRFCSVCLGSDSGNKITDPGTRLIRGHSRYCESKHLFNGKSRGKTGYAGRAPFLNGTPGQEMSTTLPRATTHRGQGQTTQILSFCSDQAKNPRV